MSNQNVDIMHHWSRQQFFKGMEYPRHLQIDGSSIPQKNRSQLSCQKQPMQTEPNKYVEIFFPIFFPTTWHFV